MKSVALAIIVSALVFGAAAIPAHAQDMASCQAQAVSKSGKPLSGAAKTASINKCMKDSCEDKAVSSTGKKLSGAAKTSFLKKCEAG